MLQHEVVRDDRDGDDLDVRVGETVAVDIQPDQRAPVQRVDDHLARRPAERTDHRKGVVAAARDSVGGGEVDTVAVTRGEAEDAVAPDADAGVGPGALFERVAAGPADQPVRPVAAVQRVGIAVADQDVVLVAACRDKQIGAIASV